jgi:heme A synthase
MGEVQQTKIRAGLVIAVACFAILGVAGTAAAHNHGCVVVSDGPIPFHPPPPTCVGWWDTDDECMLHVLFVSHDCP